MRYINVLGKFLKALPVIIVIGILILGGLKLNSYLSGSSPGSRVFLQAQIDNQKHINQILKDAVENNTKSLEQSEKSSKVSQEVIVKQNDNEKITISKAGVRELEVKKKLLKVINNYENSPKDEKASKQKDLEISTIQINSIWSAYCQGGSVDIECKGLV